MSVTLLLHLERAGDEIVWWAESDDVPGFSATAPTLVELRDRCQRALDESSGGPVELRERLVVP